MTQIRDVAARAGVSVASVSRVLSGHPSVGEDIRRRVLDAVKALDYRPDLAARRLRSRRTDTIGLIVADIRNPFFTEVSRAVEDVAYQHRMRLILCNTDEDPAREASCLELMRDENVSGVILAPSLHRLAGFRAADHPFPLVLVDRCDPDTVADAVVLDNVEAARVLTTHTIESGRRRILFLHGASSATGRQRLDGYTAAMAAHGLTAEAVGVAPIADRSREVAQVLLARPALPDAVLASSGLILLGLTQALRDAGRRVPGDVAIAGFDDQPWTRLVDPGITVVAQPTYAIGREAAELLLRRIAAPDKPVRRVVLRGELIVRGSSARA
ncbi:MAG TPA: LacI family DNA-binding transcriptional regulator [Kofleriaceae bacterium]|nr:LacI family DNA-binding transcriptional regulator [Kofleriaceae bacterium]